jgi:hypothetical protein
VRHTRTSPTERYPRDEVNTNSMPDPDEDSKATSPHNMNSTDWLTLEELESEKQKDDIEERETQLPSRDALKTAIEKVVGKMNNAAGGERVVGNMHNVAGGATYQETQDNNAGI